MPSGTAANHAVLSTLARSGDIIISDELNHASIVDGCRLSRARKRVVGHSSIEAIAEAVSSSGLDPQRRIVIVTDGVFSVDGDLANLVDLGRLITHDNVFLVVDDAHGFGVLGGGRGTAAQLGADVCGLVTTLSFSKAMGCVGGAVVGPRKAIEEIRSHARSYVFSSSLPPAMTAAALAALRLIFSSNLIDQLHANLRHFLERLDEPGLGHEWLAPIVPVIIGDFGRTVAISQSLLDAGLLAMPLGPPITADNGARIRFTISAEHTTDDLDAAAHLVRTLVRGDPSRGSR